MTFDIDKIFLPSAGVDMVFNMNSLAPYSRSSLIYDIDLKNCEITIAQPLTPFSKSTQFKELHLTTIIHDQNRKLRVGMECVQFKLIKKYPLANNTNVGAVVLKYELPIAETNIRSAFRLPIGTKFAIQGKIFYNNLEYSTPHDFLIRDISLAGLGLKIHKKRGTTANSLNKIKTHEEILIDIVLVNMDKAQQIGTLQLKTQVVRIKPEYSETDTLMGLEILELGTNNENILNKFIHEAQVDELKRLSRRDL